MVPFSSCSLVINFFWVKTLPYFTQIIFFHPIPLFEQKRCHLMTFSWRLKSKRTRAWGKRNHKFHVLDKLGCGTFIPQNKNSNWLILPYSTNVQWSVHCTLHCTLLYWRVFSLVYYVWKMAMHPHQVQSNKHNIVFLSTDARQTKRKLWAKFVSFPYEDAPRVNISVT